MKSVVIIDRGLYGHIQHRPGSLAVLHRITTEGRLKIVTLQAKDLLKRSSTTERGSVPGTILLP